MQIASKGDKLICPKCKSELYTFKEDTFEGEMVDPVMFEEIPPQPPAESNAYIICEHCGYHFTRMDFASFANTIKHEGDDNED